MSGSTMCLNFGNELQFYDSRNPSQELFGQLFPVDFMCKSLLKSGNKLIIAGLFDDKIQELDLSSQKSQTYQMDGEIIDMGISKELNKLCVLTQSSTKEGEQRVKVFNY